MGHRIMTSQPQLRDHINHMLWQPFTFTYMIITSTCSVANTSSSCINNEADFAQTQKLGKGEEVGGGGGGGRGGRKGGGGLSFFFF